MAERHPEEPVTWLAIGIYYMSISKIAEARRHFSKASVMNPRFGAAWIGFAHSFAIEGEHDQAISAYTTASRLFQGTHLPALFLGMQHLQLNNIILADEYLNTSYNMCKTDPLLLNELGVVCFHKQQLQSAINWFTKTLEVSHETESQETAWVSTHANLGHAYRKLG
ncbi:Anaphase-promoting complex subunit cut9 [Taphrina deformans PYCC 5710]|uniref:Anaphase-promoting complex subunit cut9 n=1 Tax=Taphrina deformans (strain PYCC 5710 / ATCC 11124 / CBS 356.35 / IMI 108563 / JCM 9778 / NBRC 8474) TaxID=1097556 RepID=R4X8G9_TAPDE|nr:Anaphase-promoting complex subunit cut9 [Taphrina deformans PYCC 5710]|eukprot:CCG81893.1 Anaphase-promoting complex subunit cut9 [Taphrina deformans PYCC 5710]